MVVLLEIWRRQILLFIIISAQDPGLLICVIHVDVPIVAIVHQYFPSDYGALLLSISLSNIVQQMPKNPS